MKDEPMTDRVPLTLEMDVATRHLWLTSLRNFMALKVPLVCCYGLNVSSRASKGNDSERKRHEDQQRNQGTARGEKEIMGGDQHARNVEVLVTLGIFSREFRPLLDLKSECLKDSYTIEYANGHEYEAREILLDCKLNLTDKLFDIDLILIELKSFDVVIGMNWLTEFQAKINCLEKVLQIPLEGGETLCVHREKPVRDLKIVSAIKMCKYLEKECFAFLAHVVDKDPKVKLIQDTPVVRDYPEVFPEDFPRLPPPRQVEFQIDPN
ncbi:retrotransposon protein, putative, ty3-gypsy subclass [Tanacetum coccineum]|uniref:Retrotransposon protein, putative, ty3-gypsy subclass n=1 Tax=Tanacetum coccineum TaxID=301880 RepID=A0ABQ4YBT0_9ASTR